MMKSALVPLFKPVLNNLGLKLLYALSYSNQDILIKSLDLE